MLRHIFMPIVSINAPLMFAGPFLNYIQVPYVRYRGTAPVVPSHNLISYERTWKEYVGTVPTENWIQLHPQSHVIWHRRAST
jgi:hypothetical protein